MAKAPVPDRPPHMAWRITRVTLHILGKICLWALIVVGTVALVALIAGSIFATKLTTYLKTDIIPKADEFAASLELDNIDLAQTSIIVYTDASGQTRELQQLSASQNRIWVSYDEIPLDMIHAAIAIEDKRFPEHNGVDWVRTLSAIGNFVGGDSSYGASTITQQLIKNLSQEDEVTINRKVQEIFRALAVEELYTKNEIIEWYLNTIYLGEGCYGIQSAAQVYFAKDVSELTTAECASIIAITNNPSLYDPYLNPEYNLERQRIILAEMYDQGYILTEEEYEAAKNQELVLRNGLYDTETYLCGSCGFEGDGGDYVKYDDVYACPDCGVVNEDVDMSNYYSYYVDTVYRDVLNDLCETYDLSEQAAAQKLLTGGYRIYAAIDPEVQALVDEVYEDLSNVPKTSSAQQLQSAIVIIDNATGDIVAMKGGVGEKTGSLTLNRATQSRLATGSAIKPISVYAPALEAGIITPNTAIEDSPFDEDSKWPMNESRSYSGMALVLKGVTSSLNTLSVKTLAMLGLENSYEFLTRQLGITTLVESVETGGRTYTDIAYAPLALGELTYGLTVREMTQAYATFANGGIFREARTYTRVEDSEGNIILDNTQESHTAIGEKANYYMTNMLESAVEYGTGYNAQLENMAVAGKTGTSNNNQTRWFAGYTPYYTAVVWCGYDYNEQIILTESSVNPSITMWKQVMQPLHASLEGRSFVQPDGVGWYSVCSDCGMLATDACKKDVRSNGANRVTTVRLFVEDAPRAECDCHIMVEICKETGKIANPYCAHAEGNSVKEIGMLIYNEEWLVKKDEDYVYNPEDLDLCTKHTYASIQPTEPPTDGTTPEPTEPEAALPPETTAQDDAWFDPRRIVLG